MENIQHEADAHHPPHPPVAPGRNVFFSDDTLTKTKGNGRSNAGSFSTNPRCSSSVVAPGTVGTQTDAAIDTLTFINASALPPLVALHYDENDAVRTGTSECMEAHSVERPSDTPAASDTMRTGG